MPKITAVKHTLRHPGSGKFVPKPINLLKKILLNHTGSQGAKGIKLNGATRSNPLAGAIAGSNNVAGGGIPAALTGAGGSGLPNS